MTAKSIPVRVDELEDEVAETKTRVSVIETELEHGSTIFHRLEQKLDDLDIAFRKHMAREERLFIKFGGWALAGAVTINIGLIAYIWKIQVGG